ncbi:hypothetical protein DQ353_00525 [Arthrobacter sp. AQ5-05]|uniref:hypothetical protein n=1 Tax=Arthrobacter sp. AQ5-05 TaxID=2184581 RepID=UPI000DCD8703|nr:hypothetical protein [Arthrobacter sp. AQ5-05]RAX50917.1 hypothetical protein DQ353_00525 [Arthrobacter sp. AQ5-05]
MAGKRTGLIARWLARRAGRVAPEAGPVAADADVPAHDAAATTHARPMAPSPVVEPGPRAPVGVATDPDAASSAEGTTDIPAPAPTSQAPVDEPAGEEPTAAAPAPDGPFDVAPTNAGSTPPAVAPEPEAESEERPEDETAAGDGTAPEAGKPRDQASAPRVDPGPASRDHKVITLVSLVAHSGAKTVGAALEGRARAKGWQIRATGPGLTRAAFCGMLTDTDALVLVAPADPEATAALGGKLRWLEANNRPQLPGRTVFVVNLGSADGSALQLPADLSRPLVLLPFDAALSLPGTSGRAPRRAARHAVDQLVDELSTILQEH